jgi:hypothetical protein
MKLCFCLYLPDIHVLATAAAVVLSTLAAYVLFRRTLRKFEYRKLEKDEIRLLVIKKDNFSNPVIRCSMKHAEYTALSHTWGTQQQRGPSSAMALRYKLPQIFIRHCVVFVWQVKILRHMGGYLSALFRPIEPQRNMSEP